MPSTSRSAPGISQLIVGAYTAPMGGGLGVSAFTAAASDADTVELVAGRPVPLESPSYLIRHPTLPWIYAITESGPTTVVALRLDPDGTLTRSRRSAEAAMEPAICVWTPPPVSSWSPTTAPGR